MRPGRMRRAHILPFLGDMMRADQICFKQSFGPHEKIPLRHKKAFSFGSAQHRLFPVCQIFALQLPKREAQTSNGRRWCGWMVS